MIKIRTGYSFRQAAGKIEDVLDRISEINSDYAPITDRASTFGFYKWAKECEKRKLKPVFGVELAVAGSLTERKTHIDYWTFIARDSLAPLNRLIEKATEQFYYQPLLTYDQAMNAENVNIMTGHRPQLDWTKPHPEVHIMLGPSSSKGLITQAWKNGWKFAASSDNRYPRESDRGFYEILCGRTAESHSYPQHILAPEEWLRSISHIGLDNEIIEQAETNSDFILDD